MKSKILYSTTSILILFILSGCASGKKSNFISRGYHNMTAYNNGYFNAKISMKENEEIFNTTIEDDYTTILPVFKYPDDAAAQSVQAGMDEIIKKNSIAIQLHPKSKWVDDSYFLIGKANFYKHNYTEALTSFQYVISEYSTTKKKKKKKKKDDVEMSIIEKLRHQPVHNESSLWVVRTLIEMKEYNSANTALSVIKGSSKFPEILLGELYAVEADANIKQGMLAAAIEPLEKSIANTNDKTTRARYHFILSQLYQTVEDDAKALDELKKVIDLKPDYKMDFYARLGIATLLLDNYSTSGEGTIKMLSEMLKQEKYKEFYSLLYNILAGIETAKKNTDAAVEYLSLAVRSEDADGLQKAIAYMQLGDINYTAIEYIKAYNYYDSSLISLPKDHERYPGIVLRRDGLNDLVKELQIIETEKKLQYFATLSDKALESELAKMIPEEDSNDPGQEFLDDNTTETTTNVTAGSTFYFYDASMRSRGYSEFKKAYGNRKLEDNWRRSDKTSGSYSEEETTAANIDTVAIGETIDLSKSNITRDEILASIPRTDEQKAASNARIAIALYNAGGIYKTNFENITKAKENFTENINQYPKNGLELQSLYQMYLLSDGSKKEEYKNAILSNYPGSLFANIINDHDYISKQNKKDVAVESYYYTAYEKYQMDSINELTLMLLSVDSLFKTNPLKPKFDMLSALVLAKQNKTDEFVTALQGVAKKYATDEVGIKAKEILSSMGRGDKEEKKDEVMPPTYTFKKEEEQYFVAVLNETGKTASDLKTNIANFNGVNFSLMTLKVSSLLLGKEKTLVMVKSFKNVEEAMNYYNTIINDGDVTKNVITEELTYFVISKSNYIQFYKNKDVEMYELFFDENYFNEEEDE
ncbi:MAG: hypothetical protein H7Y00_02875 [Fimbriimonadaceae bacterium]|nr:hypothetical protein [Chitinophagales bacterium]